MSFFRSTAMRRTGLLALGAAVALLVALAADPAVAQSPVPSRPASSCTGALSFSPAVVFVGSTREVQVNASGLDPDATASIYVGGQLFVTTTTNGAGAGTYTILLSYPLAGASVQVATATRCAAANLTLAVPAVTCVPVVTAFGVVGCAAGGVPFGVPFPVVAPVRQCVLPGFIIVAC